MVTKGTEDVPLMVPPQQQGKVQFGSFISESVKWIQDFYLSIDH